MNSTKKGNATAAKVPGHRILDALLTGKEIAVLADRGYDYPQVHARLAAQGSQDAIARRRYPGQRQGLTEAQIPREWWTFSLRGTRILGQRGVTADHFPVRSGFP